MKIAAQQLLEQLTSLTRDHLLSIRHLQTLTDRELTQKPSPGSWSVLECIEHLNRYGNFYLPEIKKRIENARGRLPASVFTSGWLGNYFAKSMWPEEQLNKMKTFAAMNPLNCILTREVLTNFADQLQTMLHLLEMCRHVNVTAIRTSISISSLIQLRLGDTLRVVIYHNERHLRQAKRAATLKQ